MKLTAILLLIGCLQVSANGFAQGKITMRKAKATLEEVLLEINKQTGVLYSANNETLKKAGLIDINVKNEDLKEVLSICFANQPLTYTLKENIIIVKEKGAPVKVVVVEDRNPIDVRGKVTDEKGNPVQGVTVTIKGTDKQTLTDENGEFSLASIDKEAVLVFTSVNMETFEVKVNGQAELTVGLKTKVREMSEVVVSTGYENLPRERATGSFVKINNELINRKVSTNILDRLDGVSSGVLFDRRNPSSTNIQIRGLSTLTSEIAQPLIIVDNFPYSGDISNINPNNIESVTILKDAAAASIWGAKAGNGVIVITTIKGSYNQPMKLTFNSNVTIINKPDLFELPLMKTSDYIDVEQLLFNYGVFNSDINHRSKPPLSKVVEILLKKRNNIISQEEADKQIDALRDFDVRDQFEKYIYRKAINQQHAINLRGGTNNLKYFLAFGYDKNIQNLVGNEYDRINFHTDNTYAPSKRIQIRVGLDYTYSNTITNSPGAFGSDSYRMKNRILSPYAQFENENGTIQEIDTKYRSTFTDTAGGGSFLDWKYRPLEELENNDNKTKSNLFLGNIAIQYNIAKDLSAELLYQIERMFGTTRKYYNVNTFFARDLINLYSQKNGPDVINIIPRSGILDLISNNLIGHSVRGQLNYNKVLYDKHRFAFLSGLEFREVITNGNSYRTYGYDERLNTSNVDFVTLYPTYSNVGGQRVVPNNIDFFDNISRVKSIYANASYTFHDRISVSGSIRKDASNLFGVNTNQKGVPLWSTGTSWRISNEKFYKWHFLPNLNLRATYGHNGNINNSVTALTTISYNPAFYQITNIPFANIANSPNQNLRWEKVKQLNFGIDFGSINNKISGSIEYYIKNSTDVFGLEDLDPTTGVGSLPTNSANIEGRGIDVQINQEFINTSLFGWETNFLLNYSSYKVSKYLLKINTDGYVSNGNLVTPLEGYNPYLVVSYRWAGLNPINGDPQGIIDGKPSSNFDSLAYFSPLANQVKHGSAIPLIFGSVLNTFSHKGFALSTNLTYRFNYYFRRPTISFNSLVRGQNMHNDYLDRWQTTGDEQHTIIPSMVYPVIESRDQFFTNSEVTVHKGDHIRLEDIRISYSISKKIWKMLPFEQIQVYSYLTNLNLVIWKANNVGLDPDYPSGLRPSKTVALGVKLNF